MSEYYIKKLTKLLKKTGWTQTKLAHELGVTHVALNRWLNNHVVPHASHRIQIDQLYKNLIGLEKITDNGLRKYLKKAEACRIKNISETICNNLDLQQELKLELTYNSNTIEGMTFSKKETDAVIFGHQIITNQTLLDHLALTNHVQALEDIFKGSYAEDITEATIRGLHKTVMQGIRSDAGEYASFSRAIRGVNLKLPAPVDIPEEMRHLIQLLNQRKPEEHVVCHVASTHASFEAIHPFGDGNGRVGRLMMAIQLISMDYPPVLIENARKAEYYDVLEYAQVKSPLNLAKFICEEIEASHNIFMKYS